MLFISLLYLIAYWDRNKHDPKPQKYYGITVLVPMWNEEKTIKKTLSALKKIKESYKGDLEVIVIDNNSKDSSYSIVKEYSKKNRFVRVIKETKRQGKSYALNTGIKYAKNELVACVDADSYPLADAFEHIVGYFDDKDVGSVTTKMVVNKPRKLVEHFQDLEYIYSNFLLSALDSLNSIYVTKGPLSVYRKTLLKKIGGFQHLNVTPTEDMEITFRIRKAGYIIRASKDAKVYTSVMPTWKRLFWQRIRWNRGSMINFGLHKDMILNPKYGFFGTITMPIVTITMFMIAVLIYYLINKFYNSIFLLLQKVFYYISFGYLPSINSFFIDFSNGILFVLPTLFALITIIFILWFTLNYIGFKDSKEKISFKRVVILFFSPIIYLPAQILFWVCALIIQITTKKSRWR